MKHPIYRPIADGVYQNKGSVISIGSGQNVSVSEKKRNMRVWVGELPDGWKLCEAVYLPQPMVEPMPEAVRDASFDSLTAAIALLSGDEQMRFIEAREWLTGLPDARRFLKDYSE